MTQKSQALLDAAIVDDQSQPIVVIDLRSPIERLAFYRVKAPLMKAIKLHFYGSQEVRSNR